jgi:sulfonate transport system substrate-binding protein
MMARQPLIAVLVVLLLGWVGVTTTNAARADSSTVRIGFQKYGTLVLLKEKGLLEPKLKSLGITVVWTEFPGGPQLLEALNVGSLDFGIVGEAPPIFAQAAGAPLVYVGYEPPAPTGEAILVHRDSPIRTVADLKGKRVALNKGSNVHYLLVKALEKAGLSVKDIGCVYLTPADGRAAFEGGRVDAWVIWDPFYAAAQASSDARVLTDGVDLVANTQFFMAERGYAEKNPKVIAAILDALAETDRWADANRAAVSALLSPKIGLPVSVLDVAVRRLGEGVHRVDPEIIAQQQKIADTFYQIGLIPKPITVADAQLGDKP